MLDSYALMAYCIENTKVSKHTKKYSQIQVVQKTNPVPSFTSMKRERVNVQV